MKDTSKSAFPLPCGTETVIGTNGMTLREHYAGIAMQALITAGANWYDVKGTASNAIKHADALIAELEKVAE